MEKKKIRHTKKPKREVVKVRRKYLKKALRVLQRQRCGIRATYPSLLLGHEIAKRYGITLSTIHRWKKKGLRVKRVGRLTLLNPKAVERFILFSRRRSR